MWQQQQQADFYLFFSAPVSLHCPTCYLGDSNLAAAAALPSLAEGFNLDDVVLVDWQRQLQGGGVGLHHAGTAVLVLAVHHLQGAERGGGKGEQEGGRRGDNWMRRSVEVTLSDSRGEIRR